MGEPAARTPPSLRRGANVRPLSGEALLMQSDIMWAKLHAVAPGSAALEHFDPAGDCFWMVLEGAARVSGPGADEGRVLGVKECVLAPAGARLSLACVGAEPLLALQCLSHEASDA